METRRLYITRQLFKNILLLLVGWTSLCQAVQAQQLQASLSHFSTDNGLASNAISNMAQDDYGYIWLATWNGLSRFDGYNFYNYRTGNGSGIPNLHNRIHSLAIDNQQNVWLRMYDGRVFVMKRSIDSIINPFEGINGSEEYRTDHPLTVTSAGDVLVTINGVGLYKLRIEGKGVNSQLITTGGLEITSMAEGYQNDIWLGTNQGVHRMDISNLTIERKGMFTEEHITCLYSNGYHIYAGTQSGNIYTFAYGQEPKQIRKGNFPLNTIFVDSHGLVWFSDTQQGALKLDPATGEERHYVQTITVPDYGGMGGMFKETGNVLWIRMNHGGYGYYNRQRDEVEYFHNDPINPWNLSNTVNASLELNEGVVWESTSRRGLEKLEILKNTISRNLLVPDAPQTPANEIRAMYYDRDRKLLLIGNKNSGLYLIRNDSTRTVITTDSKGNPLGRLYGITKDSKGNYWLCSKDKGVFWMTPNSTGYTLENFSHDDNNPHSLGNNNAYCALEDKKGNVWIATYGGGVNVLVKDKEGRPMFMNPQNAMKTYPYHSHQKVRTLALDKDGNVWAGTTDGILIMSLQGNDFTIKPLQPSKEAPEKILMSNDVVCIERDRMGEMWVGTNGGGLAHSIGRDTKGQWLFETFGSQDGLPSEEILSIAFDSHGNVWFATDHVLCSYDTGKNIFTTFSSLDGVDETMCSEGAAIVLPNDNIIFGTINGYYLVDRKKLVTTAGSMLKLRITDFWLNDVLQSPRYTSDYDYYIPDSREVRLPSHNSAIAFRFVSLNYQLQHRIHYQYMLEGYDRVWKNGNRSRIVNYNNLPTGQYRFKVKCFLLESPEKFDQRVISVVVPPYFLLSSNSIWLYMLLCTILAIWLMLWRQHKLAKEEEFRRLHDTSSDVTYQNNDEAHFMAQLMDWLDKNASNPALTVENMIESAGLDEEEYNNKLQQYTGLTAKELLGQFRLQKAQAFLQDTNDSIADIAFNSGFSDPTVFNRVFKSNFGISPSTYRDEYQKQQNDKTDEYEIIEE